MKVFTKMLSVLMVLALSSALVFGQSANLEKLKVSAAQNLTADIEPGVVPVTNLNSEVIMKNFATSNPAKSELWNNGPLITAPGAGSGGTDYSALQDASLGMGTYGFGCQISAGNSMADDFEVTGTWTVNTITFFSYQTNSGTISTLNDIRVQIWDAAPNAGGAVIWGNLTTNVMSSTSWTNIWRVLESAPAETRPIMQITANTAGLVLEAGTYWVEYSIGGTGSSGPWAPAVTIVGESTTGNGLQYTTAGWAAAVDGGTMTGQGFPFVIEGESGGTSNAIFEDDFDSYTSGGQVACQNPTEWTTWSNAPCGSEDAYVSNLYAHSGANSAVIAFNNDLVKDFGTPYTSGKYSINFYAYIPATKAGYFNTLQSFAGASSVWGLEVYFNAGGAGSINANGTGTATFTWAPDVWFMVEHIVDMDMDYSEIWIDGVMLYSYQWSLGATGTGQNTLDANDFFGATANDQMYIDDYTFEEVASTFGDPPTNLTAEVGGNDVYLAWVAPGSGPTGSILCVDRDGSFDGGYSDSWATIQAALDANSLTYDYFEVTDLTQDGPSLATMQGYDIIFWFSGESWGYYGNDAMTTNDENNVAQFLDGGGSLFFSGMDYFYGSYSAAGNFTAGQFPYDYLGVTSTIQDNWSIFSPATGNASGGASSFAAGIDFTIQDIYSAKDGLYIDKITHMGQDLFNVTNPTPAGIAAVQYSAGNFKTAFTTVDLAAVVDAADLTEIVGNAVEWFTAKNSGKALLGYNVYRDGNMIDFTTATSYDDMDLPDGTYEYYVTAVYDEGESEPSNSAFAVVFTSGGTVFEYNFEDYTAGQQVACENPTEWTTWSNAPCGTEDAIISTDYALSGVNSAKVSGTNDLVKTLGALTTGHYKLSFNMYIPTGKLGYFNLLQDFAGAGSQWGMQVYLGDDNAGPTPGVGWIDGGAALAASFNFDYDTWNLLEADVDLDQDWAEFYFNGVLVHGYVWSSGTFGTGTLNQLDGVNFYAFAGVGGTPLYYFDDFMMEDLSAPPLPAPTNLAYTIQNDFDVNLTWNAPGGAVGLQGYNIYRNTVNVGYVAAPTTQYNDLNLAVGTYNYYVKAVYPSGESPASNTVTAVIVNPQPPAPTNLVASGAATGIQLTWEGVGAGQWIQWDAGVNNGNAVGLTNGGTFSVASHWTPADLGPYAGFSLQKIQFFPSGDPAATFVIKVWSGATGTTLLHTQNLSSVTIDEWNEVVLTSPVLIPAATDFWFGYSVTHLAGTFPAGADDGPAIQGKGDMISTGGAWSSLYTLTGGAIDANWNISGFVGLVDGESTPLQPIVEVSAPVIYNASFAASGLTSPSVKFNPNSTKDFTYNVYHKLQGGTYAPLATGLSATTYLHQYPGMGMHYYVVRTENNGVESPNSNEASFLYTSIEEMIYDQTQVYPNPANGVVNIKSEFDIHSVKVFNHAGQIIANESVDTKFYQFNTSQFAPGLYMFQIETNEGTITKRIIVE